MLLTTVAMAAAVAQDRPGIDRPIRVGQFRGTGTGGSYWHDNIHQSSVLLNTILTNPSTSNLGDSLIVPTHNPPFTYTSFGVVTTGGTSAPPSGKTPTVAQTNEFIAALDTLDVAIISCMVNFETIFTTPAQREALLSFTRRKGYLAIHATTDTQGGWAQGDSIHGTAFRQHPNGDRNGRLVRDSVFQADAAWNYLNQGLFSNSLDTSFTEEWFFFTTSAAAIRSQTNLKPTTKLDESSLTGSGIPTLMGDHPHSWYRNYPDSGGRTFYTAVGHRPNLWNTNAQAPRFFRRQLYNAILWLAKYDSAGTSSIRHTKAPGVASDYSRLAVSPSALTVSVIQPGNHTVELLSLDGKRLAFRQGTSGQTSHEFKNLRSGVYVVSVATGHGRSSRLATVP